MYTPLIDGMNICLLLPRIIPMYVSPTRRVFVGFARMLLALRCFIWCWYRRRLRLACKGLLHIPRMTRMDMPGNHARN